MRPGDREAAANWSILLGGVLLFVSLFLTWSEQFSAAFRHRLPAGALAGIPRTPTAWQVYSAADMLLCLLAAVLAWAALSDRAVLRRLAAAGVAAGLAFVAHAVAVAPTDGLLVAIPARGGRLQYAATGAVPGPGEIVALGGLALALAGLLAALRRSRARPAGEREGRPVRGIRPPRRAASPS